MLICQEDELLFPNRVKAGNCFLKEHGVLKWDNVQEPLSVHTGSFYLSLSVPQQQISLSSALRERRHVWTTPDMTGCLAISIRANENWEKADRLSLQIGASGVKLQEYANYLNWSGDGFLITNLIKLPIVLHAPCCTGTEQDVSEIGYNALKRLNAISSVSVILFRHVRWWKGPQPWSVNNGFSVDLIRRGGSI